MPIADRLERLFRSPEGVVARTLECALWNPEAYSRGGIPRECILAADTNSEVTALSSYTDLVAASWLRHDLPRKLLYGDHGVGILLWPTANRGVASARDVGWATQARYTAGRAEQGLPVFCADGSAASLGESMAEAADKSCRAAETFNDARSRFIEANYGAHACAWHDWERMAQTAHAFVTAPRRDGSQQHSACTPNAWDDVRCVHNQVFVSYEPKDVAAVYLLAYNEDEGGVHDRQMVDAYRLALALHASLVHEQARAHASDLEAPPLVMINVSCAINDTASLLSPMVWPPPPASPPVPAPPPAPPRSPLPLPPPPPLRSPQPSTATALDGVSFRYAVGLLGVAVAIIALLYLCWQRRRGGGAPHRPAQRKQPEDDGMELAPGDSSSTPRRERPGMLFDR